VRCARTDDWTPSISGPYEVDDTLSGPRDRWEKCLNDNRRQSTTAGVFGDYVLLGV